MACLMFLEGHAGCCVATRPQGLGQGHTQEGSSDRRPLQQPRQQVTGLRSRAATEKTVKRIGFQKLLQPNSPINLVLKTTEISSLSVLEARGPKSVSLRQNLGTSKVVCVLQTAASWSLAASGSCWLSFTCGHVVPVFKASPSTLSVPSSHPFLSVYQTSLHLPLIRIHMIIFVAHLDNLPPEAPSCD